MKKTSIKKNEIIWVYESPDNGKTIYRRPVGKLKPRQLIVLNIPIYNN